MIVHESASCFLEGEQFDPLALQAETKLPLTRPRIKGEIITYGRFRGQKAELGSAWITMESDEFIQPLTQLLDALITYKEIILGHGVDWNAIQYISYAAYYEAQCNFAFTCDEHRKLAELGLDLWVSCYETEGEEDEDHISPEE